MILVHEQPPIYLLAKDSLNFPDPRRAGDMTPLCVGGDLGASRLLEAYRHGIFPWFIEDGLVHWYSPNPRGVIWLDGYRPPRSLLKFLGHSTWEISFDRNFDATILQCALVERKHEDGTWISPEFRAAYGWMHRLGYAHSVEVYEKGVCIGGLYGLALGKCFFGESMFSLQPNASKAAFAGLASLVQRWGFICIDCQVLTPHLQMLGAEAVARDVFLDQIAKGVTGPMLRGRWDVTLAAQEVAEHFRLTSPR